MEFQKPVSELIKIRKSYRSYNGRDIESATRQKLEDYIAKISIDTKIKVRFVLTSNQNVSGETKKLGTYGVISGARSFIVGILNKDEKDAVEFGYLFEKIVLFATDLGLQTCWLGGSFNRRDFKRNINLAEDEFIPIVSPVGYNQEKPSIIESVMRAVAGADNRKLWNQLFFKDNNLVPLDENSSGSYAVPLEMARLAPSASNKQPWRIIKIDNEFHFFLCRTKGYGVTFYDMQRNDIGIAKCHFELTAIELGLKGRWLEMKNINTPAGWEYIVTWSTSDN